MATDDDGPRCGAAPRPGGSRTGPCRARPLKGATRCAIHGGKSPNAVRAAEVNRAEAAWSAKLARIRPTPVTDPLGELSSLVGEAIMWKDMLGERVAELTSFGYRSDNGEQVRADVVLFERAMDRCATVLALIAKLNIDDRLARISEAQAERIADAFTSSLDELGIPLKGDSRRQIVKLFNRRLTVVAG